MWGPGLGLGGGRLIVGEGPVFGGGVVGLWEGNGSLMGFVGGEGRRGGVTRVMM